MINSISAVTVLLIGLGLGISYKVNALATITFLILYLASIIGLNLIAGAVVLIVKQGNPIALFTSVASNLLGGVVFPISVLPTWLRYISYSLSLTWALSGA
ncbi:ABC transporter permease [Vulcanisaeta distributa]|uniref:ABC transporter permease n=1 Tax=Vulcanisaeta distributa TaxID=164451 RepID=UPI000A403A9C|nr:ABC transporter permease [Vulcanisaeta distributa]